MLMTSPKLFNLIQDHPLKFLLPGQILIILITSRATKFWSHDHIYNLIWDTLQKFASNIMDTENCNIAFT